MFRPKRKKRVKRLNQIVHATNFEIILFNLRYMLNLQFRLRTIQVKSW